jgi:hypothetical protein
MSLGICFENQELSSMLPFIFKTISSSLYAYDIFNEKIENPDEFQDIHRKLLKHSWKKISFNTTSNFEDKKEMKENSKKRIDKESKLYVVNRLKSIKKYSLNSVWEPIQYNVYLNLMHFYNLIGNLNLKLAYGMSYLQTLANFITSQEQFNFASNISTDSSMLQEKIFLNLSKLPTLVKIIPLASDVKFDTTKGMNTGMSSLDMEPNQKEGDNSASAKTDKVFLYNPWEKDDNINYFWTTGSYQSVYVQFYNPLSLELRINKIVLIFEGCKPFSFPSKLTIYY